MSLMSSRDFQDKAERLAQVGRFLAQQGWSPATSSNYSARLETNPDHFALTRSGIDKYEVRAEDIIVVNEKGLVVEPVGQKPSAETLIHCELYKDPTVGSVLHTHSVFGTRLSLKYLSQEKIEIRDYELLKGLSGNRTHAMVETVPILENSQDMIAFSQKLEPVLKLKPKIHGFLIAGHGLYTWGRDINEAKRHVETFEFLFQSLAYAEMGF